MRKTLRERFEEKFIPEPTSGCFLWTDGTGAGGYGRINVRGKACRAHRISYELYVGEIPDGMHVLHKCDVRTCCNPEHLFVGTDADNMADMMKKKRHANCKGTSNGRAKLTDSDIPKIRSDERVHRKIAADFGISHRMVGLIKSRKKWAHI